MQKKETFGIRKIGTGICSVLLSLLFLGGHLLAEEIPTSSETH